MFSQHVEVAVWSVQKAFEVSLGALKLLFKNRNMPYSHIRIQFTVREQSVALYSYSAQPLAKLAVITGRY